MQYSISEVLEFVRENDVKFIRLAFCDIFGTQKNISIMPSELPRAFSSGISFDASAIAGFMQVEESDLFLVPDPTTLCILPWRPSHGSVVRLFCDIKKPDGTPFMGDARALLRQTVQQLAAYGFSCKAGFECEFYLFQQDENGSPTLLPLDQGNYFDIAPLDKGENVRREICLTLERMGITPETSHHEQGPGQNEIDFKYSDPLTTADQFITFKSVVKTVAARNGLFASFLPKPLSEQSGSGLHINLSLYQNCRNLFSDEKKQHAPETEHFIAGILDRICEMTVFLNPLTNSYRRLGSHSAPRFVTWSHQNRSQLIRIPAAAGDNSRMELRSPDPACNPYWALTLILHAGLEGLQQKKKLPAPLNLNLFQAEPETTDTLMRLPDTLISAIAMARESAFIQGILPSDTLQKYLATKEVEWEAYQAASDKDAAEERLYFSFI